MPRRGDRSRGERRPMIPTLIRLALSQRWLVLMVAGMLVALGVWAFQHQQIDAYPDISGQMVQIITTYPGRARRKWNAR